MLGVLFMYSVTSALKRTLKNYSYTLVKVRMRRLTRLLAKNFLHLCHFLTAFSRVILRSLINTDPKYSFYCLEANTLTHVDSSHHWDVLFNISFILIHKKTSTAWIFISSCYFCYHTFYCRNMIIVLTFQSWC